MLAGAQNSPVAAQAADTPAPSATGWRVTFAPQPHLFMTGNDPARLLRELATLGPCKVVCDSAKLPAFGEFEPETCYLAWQIELNANVPEAAVREVFEWVDNDAEIAIVPILPPPAEVKPKAEEPAAASDEEKPAARPSRIRPARLRRGEADAESPEAQATAEPTSGASPDQAGGTEERRQTERRSTERRSAERRESGAAAAGGGAGGAAGGTSIRVDVEKVDGLINSIGQLVITQSMLMALSDNFTLEDVEKLREGLAQLERNTRELQENIMSIRMMPISFSFNRFPRLVRDLSTKLGKEVQLRVLGENTELDKTVMEKIGDPLVHLVRNALDHGLETPDVRLASGKSASGTLTLNAYHEGGGIVIEISDDGAGLNRQKILEKAREKGICGPAENPSDAQVYDYIFAPGFSTAAVVSDVSGRGVGMDVVRRNIKDLGGTVVVHSQPGLGALFRIRLPLTLAILDGQLVRVGASVYIVPLIAIIESLQIERGAVESISNQTEIYRLREEYLPVVRLHELLGIAPASTRLEDCLLVVVEVEGRKFALLVDELLGQQQVVVKSLQTNFRSVAGVSGATILGNGAVAMILDVGGIIRLCRERAADLPLLPPSARVA
jgi:two-component system chemotaxis sensor kinase CheA